MDENPAGPDVDDFADPDVGDGEPTPLRRLVMAQFHEPGGAAVQLFTSATLDGRLPDAGPGPDAGLVAATARALDLDPTRVELFSSDAYLLQSALGERALGGDVPLAEPAPTVSSYAGTWDERRSAALTGAPIIACNYHDVPRENRPAVEERLRRLRDLGEVLDLGTDVTAAAGPRVVVGFYDAYRDAGLFGAELCERLGLRALFFPIFEQHDEPGAADLRDDELADIAAVHELGFHTAGHARADRVTDATLQHEVHDVLDRLTAIGGRLPRVAAWRGGTRWDPAHVGDRALRERGVRHVMSNWAVETIPTSGPAWRPGPAGT